MKKKIYSNRVMFAGIAMFIVILSTLSSCTKKSTYDTSSTNTGTKGSSGVPGANEVWIQNMAFTPSTITVAAGITITWTNKDAMAHTVTSDQNWFNSGNLGTGATYSKMFLTAGTYTYHCAIHPSMTGTVIVN
jgi:plastocyanin